MAYMDAIARAKNYILISNQYFISSIDQPLPENRIIDAIYKRLAIAIKNHEKFRIFVFIPIWSAGDITTASTQCIVHLTQKTFNLDATSLVKKLAKDFPNVKDFRNYITIHSLRNWGSINGAYPIFEQVYIHAKIMIVDDKIAIIGSANINDRSMLGDRDSEICCVIEGPTDKVLFDRNITHKVSEAIYDLRIKLLNCYLGAKRASSNLFQILWSELAIKEIRGISKRNTIIYNKVFKHTPDTVQSFLDLAKMDPRKKEYGEYIDLTKIEDLTGLEGLIVDFPFGFLKDENLTPAILTPEGWLTRIYM
jgi:phospholipase D1/2